MPEENRRTIAMCEECGALYAAFEITAGEFRPIGQRDGCQCGSTDFTPVDDDASGLSLD
ncbi:hypothetical protein HTZ84_01450 [Haloterrigena sp. SYSU A558-1]|uniref:Uncharacterized protein n=1 Tax=Haloterrigena gelatinilytica TaxID=2741724 RepID=A0A8J8KHI1_9EURY|nr:hypothetical protein [Haloterrigena gelatinilytica]NUB93102.1 hypothetical protein [Haloterrigena gelatinilytica]NUC70988.1 hypothetical protein [Haloterrigena gelatinilytica]